MFGVLCNARVWCVWFVLRRVHCVCVVVCTCVVCVYWACVGCCCVWFILCVVCSVCSVLCVR